MKRTHQPLLAVGQFGTLHHKISRILSHLSHKTVRVSILFANNILQGLGVAQAAVTERWP